MSIKLALVHVVDTVATRGWDGPLEVHLPKDVWLQFVGEEMAAARDFQRQGPPDNPQWCDIYTAAGILRVLPEPK